MLSECEEREMYLIRQVRDSLSPPPFYIYIMFFYLASRPSLAFHMFKSDKLRCEEGTFPDIYRTSLAHTEPR